MNVKCLNCGNPASVCTLNVEMLGYELCLDCAAYADKLGGSYLGIWRIDGKPVKNMTAAEIAQLLSV